MPEPTVVPAKVEQLAEKLAAPRPMRKGSVSTRYIKCSKPGCRCAEDPAARHGPYFSLTRAVKGRTQSRYLSAQEAELVQRQIDRGREFREHVKAYWEAAEQWADGELETAGTLSAEAEKGGSKKRSRRKSPGNSRS
jgi:hypothetical protein